MVLGAEPVRTCVGCRNRAPASTLLRVVAVVDTGVPSLAVDPGHRLPGRGAYLHVDPDCLAKADKRRAFTRALRVAGALETGELAAYVTAQAVRAGADSGAKGNTTVTEVNGPARQVVAGRPPRQQGRTTKP